MDLYERIFEESGDAQFVADADTGGIVAANRAAADLVGRGRDEVLDAHFSDFHVDSGDSRHEELFREVLATGRITTEEHHVVTAKGERIPVEMSASVVDVGDRRLIQGSFRDITERRALEERLREERERYRRIFANSNDAIFVVDPEADEILDCNQRACEMLGYDYGDMVGKPLSEVHPQEMDKFRSFAGEVFEDGEAWTDELTCLTCDGERLPTVMAASTIQWDDDTAMLACVQDISEQRSRERALEELQNTAQGLLEARSSEETAQLAVAAVAVVLDTPYGTVWFRDDEGAYEPAAATAAADREGLPVVDDVDGFLRDATTGNTSVIEAMPATARESPLGCLLVVPLGDHGALTVGIADESPSETDRRFVEILGANVAAALERAARERDIERTNEQLAILNRIVRHDIRNDAAVVMAELERARMAIEGETGDDVDGHLQHALNGAEHVVELTATVGDLVDVLTGDSDPGGEPIDLAEMVTGELDRARTAYPDTDFDVTVERRPTVSANGMLSSAFRNLVNNAVDHHDGAHPTVTVTVGQDGDHAFVRVEDDGPGIPDDRKEAVFGRGEQGLGSNGVGLGLYLVDRLVTQFGGEVELADSPSGGASFTVRLPAVSG